MKIGGSAHKIELLCCGWYLAIRNGEIQAGKYLFPAVLLADLELEPINPADPFVLTYLAVDMFPVDAGGRFASGNRRFGFRV